MIRVRIISISALILILLSVSILLFTYKNKDLGNEVISSSFSSNPGSDKGNINGVNIANPAPTTSTSTGTVVTSPTPTTSGSTNVVVTNPTPTTSGSTNVVVTNPTPTTSGSTNVVVTNPTPTTSTSTGIVVTSPTPTTSTSTGIVVTSPTPTTSTSTGTVVTDPTPTTSTSTGTIVTDPTPTTSTSTGAVVTDPTPTTSTSTGTVVTDPTPTTSTIIYDNRIGLGSDTNGIPILEKHQNAQYIYWNPNNPNASDSNSGTDPNYPKLTLASAWSALRDGYGDWLLLAEGATSSEGFGVLALRSGLNTQYPIVVTTYNSAAPTDVSKMRKGLATIGTNATVSILQTNKGQATRNVVFENINFDNSSFAPRSVFLLEYGLGDIEMNWLFHNVRFLHTQVYIQGTGPGDNDYTTNYVFRHCTFAYSWTSLGSHSQGIYISKSKNITIEDSIFYHNGWQVSRDETYGADTYKHNIYIQTNAYNTMFRRNISGHASSHGIQMNGGGTIIDSVFASNPINILLGGGTNYMTVNPNGINGSIINNVIVGSSDINSSLPSGFGIDFSNTSLGTIGSGNIISNIVPSSGPTMSTSSNRTSFSLSPSPGDINTYPINVKWDHNIEWNWVPTINGVNTSLDNQISSNSNYKINRNYNIIHYSKDFGTNKQSPSTPFLDPNRDLGTYATSHGYKNEDSLWQAMISDPTKPWAKLISDYIRAGYGR
nr:hypothetical protein [Candidatus Gracilibacteria bacterium]